MLVTRIESLRSHLAAVAVLSFAAAALGSLHVDSRVVGDLTATTTVQSVQARIHSRRSSLRGEELHTYEYTFSPHSRTPVKHTPAAGSCDLCGDNWLFVLGAGGRTGSTTALEMFDAVPGFEISGEHFGVLSLEADYLQRMLERGKFGTTPAWKHRPTDTQYMYCSIQDRLKNSILGAGEAGDENLKVIGVKEILYVSERMLSFIHQVFPCARFVFTFRSNPEVGTMASNMAGQQEVWKMQTPLFEVFQRSFSHQTRMMAVEEMDTDHFNKVLHDIIGVRGCSFTRVLHANKDGSLSHDDTQDLLSGPCDLSGVDFRLSEAELSHNKGLLQTIRSRWQGY